MHVVAATRLVLARRPWLYWAIVTVLAAGLAVAVHEQSTALDAARDEWRATRTVLVAERALRPRRHDRDSPRGAAGRGVARREPSRHSPNERRCPNASASARSSPRSTSPHARVRRRAPTPARWSWRCPIRSVGPPSSGCGCSWPPRDTSCRHRPRSSTWTTGSASSPSPRPTPRLSRPRPRPGRPRCSTCRERGGPARPSPVADRDRSVPDRRDDPCGPGSRLVPVVADDGALRQGDEEVLRSVEVGHLDERGAERVGDVGVAARTAEDRELGRELRRPAGSD